jgi:hypothetical protein
MYFWGLTSNLEFSKLALKLKIFIDVFDKEYFLKNAKIRDEYLTSSLLATYISSNTKFDKLTV